jgi:hypothetical protein
MDTAFYPSVAGKGALQNHYTDLASQSIEPLDMLAAKSPNLAKWRSVAVDGQIVPSYVLIGPRIGRVPIRLGLFGGVRTHDFLSTISIAKLLVELDLAPIIAQDFALFAYPLANPSRGSFGGRTHSDSSANGGYKTLLYQSGPPVSRPFQLGYSDSEERARRKPDFWHCLHYQADFVALSFASSPGR